MRRYALIFGTIAGVVLVLMMFLTMPFLGEDIDYDTAEWLGYISMIVALSAIFIGIKSYRDKESAGLISFGKAFKVGLFITLVASVFYVAGWILYINTAGTNFMDSYYQHSVEKIKTSNDPETEIQAKIADMEKWRELYKNPLIQIGVTFIEIFPVGLLITIISATILKKKNP
ncbi:MAG: DUF4199 domain-containing protein [Caldithrix sp.]|nr:MAG: DUF4199 domain-containing protein [Caldithrix sp.]